MRLRLLVPVALVASVFGAGCGAKPPLVLDAGCADCECTPGLVEPCYPGPEGTEGVSACAGGQRTCDSAGHFGACLGAVIPAGELCNGLDDDCDGLVDEDFGEASCGVGACRVTVTSCVDGGTVACEPLRPAVRESCEGTDDDCDGEVDEGCACLDGKTQPCFSGAPGVRGVGRCKDGMQTCSSGAWSGCAGEVLPGTEQCNGLDDDCNGLTEEGDPLLGAPCSTGLPGICAAGTNACTTGLLVCVQNLQSTAEACNGRDDDCNGQTDEGSPGGGQLCSTGLAGVCSKGFTACQSESVVCVGESAPAAELCDGLDNDCDGVVDEGNPGGGQSCSTGLLGVCSAGTTNCASGQLQCVPTQQPSAEACNGEDDDCDGQVDDSPMGVGQACVTALPGVCSAGVTVCSNGAASCQQTTQASTEVCNTLDDDCDGTVNEGNPGGGVPCSTGLSGVCGAGLTTCSGGVISCGQSVQSSPETCDGQDNDCDGATDEGNPGGGLACNTGSPGQCAAGTTMCSGGSVQCLPNTPASPELCDGADNDCDGTVDDGNPGGNSSCSTGLPGVCAAGLTRCTAGTVVCEQTQAAVPEVCDGKDNDCDAVVDQGNPGGGVSCSTGLQGVCAAGTSTCSGGVLLCPQNQQPAAETCNLKDDDCDGQTDEDFDLTKDPGNCGVCGNVCGSATGGLCCSSVCVVPGVNNCGACGLTCASGTVVVNELLIDPDKVPDSQGEWFELYNPGTVAIDLRGFVVSDLGTDTHTINSATPVMVPPGGYTVLGLNANTGTNGGVTVGYQYSGVALGNSGDELIVTGHGVELDRVVWGGTFDAIGAAQELSRNHQTAALNDTLTNWCNAMTPFGAGDRGTPGAANVCAR